MRGLYVRNLHYKFKEITNETVYSFINDNNSFFLVYQLYMLLKRGQIYSSIFIQS